MSKLLRGAMALVCSAGTLGTLAGCMHDPDYVKPTSTTAKASDDDSNAVQTPSQPPGNIGGTQPSAPPAPPGERGPSANVTTPGTPG